MPNVHGMTGWQFFLCRLDGARQQALTVWQTRTPQKWTQVTDETHTCDRRNAHLCALERRPVYFSMRTGRKKSSYFFIPDAPKKRELKNKCVLLYIAMIIHET